MPISFYPTIDLELFPRLPELWRRITSSPGGDTAEGIHELLEITSDLTCRGSDLACTRDWPGKGNPYYWS